MPNTQSNIPRRWQEIARTQHREFFTSALAKLRQIDEDIDYSYEQSMYVITQSRPDFDNSEISRLVVARDKLRARKYQIIASLLAATVNG